MNHLILLFFAFCVPLSVKANNPTSGTIPVEEEGLFIYPLKAESIEIAALSPKNRLEYNCTIMPGDSFKVSKIEYNFDGTFEADIEKNRRYSWEFNSLPFRQSYPLFNGDV